MKGNNAIQTNHFKKTAKRVKTWFNQPARAERRRKNRLEKAKKCFPMPIDKLRPIVRYNKKLRLGRGFTAEELKEAGLDYNYARTVGIAVDLRRRNHNKETFDMNVQRVKDYMSKVTIYDSFRAAKEAGAKQHKGKLMPLAKSMPVVKSIDVTAVSAFN